MYDNKTSGILIRLQLRYVIIGLFLTNASIEILSDAFAGSASAPLGIAATVVNSCKFTTVSSLVVSESSVSINIATNFSPVMDLACSHGQSPRIAFDSRTQETGAVLIGSTMTAASRGSREVLTESSPNQNSTRPEKVRGMMIVPQKYLAPKMIASPDKYNSGQNVSVGNYTDYVVVTVNF